MSNDHCDFFSVDSLLLRRLLANLWARGAALQCCFLQESIDLLFVTYTGSIAANETFDVANLSAGVIQVKFKMKADTKAELALRPLGIPRLLKALPYLAMLLELGNETNHQKSGSRIQTTPPADCGEFEDLQNEWLSSVKSLQGYKLQKTGKKRDAEEVRLLKDVEVKQVAMDAYNRFTVSVRGTSPEVYGVLNAAKIANEFATLLRIIMPAPTGRDTIIQQMRPLEHLGDTSAHTNWMSVYVVDDPQLSDQPEAESMDVD